MNPSNKSGFRVPRDPNPMDLRESPSAVHALAQPAMVPLDKHRFFAGRKRARRYALQALYSWVLNDNSIADIEAFMLSEHQSGDLDLEYFQTLLHQIPQQFQELDACFSPYLINRTPQELDLIELSVLRIAVYEFKMQQDLPYRVVINEALELAKTFGSDESYKFVNSVLDKVRKDLRSSN